MENSVHIVPNKAIMACTMSFSVRYHFGTLRHIFPFVPSDLVCSSMISYVLMLPLTCIEGGMGKVFSNPFDIWNGQKEKRYTFVYAGIKSVRPILKVFFVPSR